MLGARLVWGVQFYAWHSGLQNLRFFSACHGPVFRTGRGRAEYFENVMGRAGPRPTIQEG